MFYYCNINFTRTCIYREIFLWGEEVKFHPIFHPIFHLISEDVILIFTVYPLSARQRLDAGAEECGN